MPLPVLPLVAIAAGGLGFGGGFLVSSGFKKLTTLVLVSGGVYITFRYVSNK